MNTTAPSEGVYDIGTGEYQTISFGGNFEKCERGEFKIKWIKYMQNKGEKEHEKHILQCCGQCCGSRPF
jgi:hypothetical protein